MKLVYGTNTVIDTPWGWKRPYPTGEERKAIDTAFDALFDAMETKETEQGTALYSRDLPSDDQAEAITDLNDAMARFEGVDDAFQYSPDADETLTDAFQQVFGVDIVPIKLGNAQANGFLAMQYHGKLFVRTDSARHGFVQMAGHELLHQIKQESPELYEWFNEQADDYIRNDAESRYGRRLQAVGADLATLDVREEILADFTGDALADPRFLQALATRNPSKFTQLAQTVINWLKSVAQKLSRAGFGSSIYFDQVDELRGHLAEVLNAYKSGGADAIGQLPLFARDPSLNAGPQRGGQVSYNQDMFSDPSQEEAATVQAAIEGKTVVEAVFPARVGMNRPCLSSTWRGWGVPHASGKRDGVIT